MQWLSSLGTVGEVLRIIILIFEVLLVFNLMILVHEWGHFLAARWRGLKVEAFYIWFGKPLWKKTINGVEYGLGSIPAGGFVKLPQMAPMGTIEGESTSEEPLPPIKPLDKMIVAFAGPLFSFGLACVFALLVSWLGKPQSEAFVTTTIGYVVEDSPSAKAGLKAGDVIKSIDGLPIRRFEGFVDSVRWGVIASEGTEILFEVDRPGEGIKKIPVSALWPDVDKKPSSWWKSIFERPVLREVGIMGKSTPMVGAVQENSPAADAGLQPNDEILSVDGIPLLSPVQLREYLEDKGGKSVQVLVRRTDKKATTAQSVELTVSLTPRIPDKAPPEYDRPMVGIEWHATGERKLAYPPVSEQISDAARSMFSMISKLVSGNSDISPAHMSGPVGIGRVYYNLLQDPAALLQILWFSVVLNINLAIMNMLPFPVLDGGHITMAIAEAIRRKPLHSRALEWIQTACALTLFGFIFFVTFKDLGDIFIGGGNKKPNPSEELKWLPKDQRPDTN
ncbi:regulator of sigma E protease [Prosthecobacter fusiformis]|uniref:Regulator of sigma E protease n=1 Tax=Prosthecobacter fusiformis TaxID=48464 RepID=A0A4R7RZH7_9BACT|nr:RIP metalloprotease RseP [Prosthecobacter fusiformis]TDU71271.1 regulator of sigma E protease [Prosthecobacter fusiformis]